MKAKLLIALAIAIVLLALYLGPLPLRLLVAGRGRARARPLGRQVGILAHRSELPRNRVRHQRIRLYLRLHPGRGHATWWELHRHWARTAAYRRVSRVRSS